MALVDIQTSVFRRPVSQICIHWKSQRCRHGASPWFVNNNADRNRAKKSVVRRNDRTHSVEHSWTANSSSRRPRRTMCSKQEKNHEKVARVHCPERKDQTTEGEEHTAVLGSGRRLHYVTSRFQKPESAPEERIHLASKRKRSKNLLKYRSPPCFVCQSTSGPPFFLHPRDH